MVLGVKEGFWRSEIVDFHDNKQSQLFFVSFSFIS